MLISEGSERLKRVLSVVLALVVVLGMAKPAIAQSTTPSSSIAPLATDLHLGYGTFAPIPAKMLPMLDERIAEATSAGLDVARIMVDWAEIETIPGQYDLSVINEQLERVPDGVRLFVTLSVTDVERYSVPSDLMISETELNIPLDEPGIIARYQELLDSVLPNLVDNYGAFALSVANEPNVLLGERPAAEATALANFTEAISNYALEWFPGLFITMTISGGGITYPAEFLPDLIAVTDIAAFNWGCIDLATFMVTEPATISGDIALLLAAADGREIIIQELSCPSGYAEGASFIGRSPQQQADWLEAFFAAIRAVPQFRAAFVFDLIDWPGDMASTYVDFLRAEGLNDIADRYGELLSTWGLLTFDDLSPKPSWDIFLDAVESAD